jgi:CBS domain-containing protein
MDAHPPTVGPETGVAEVARLLLEQHLSGVPVVAGDGRVLGVVTQADLVARHAYVHFPQYLSLLGNLIPLAGERRFREEVRRIAGRAAADVMTAKPYVVDEADPLQDVATRMAEDGIDPVIVAREGRLVGLITREHLVRLIATEESAS